MSFPLHDNDKLIKQTYSVYVFLPEDRGQDITRKWHLTAYFNQSTVDELTLIEDVPNVGRIPVPEGLFKSARATKSKRDDPRRNAFMTPGGSESYTLSSDSGALYTIFPSSGNGAQTAHAYTHDGSPRNHSAAPDPGPRSVHSGVQSPRSPHLHAGPSSTLPRTIPIPMTPTTQARLPGVRQPPSLVPLEYLQTCSNTRNPTDRSMVDKLSVPNDPSRPSSSHGVNASRTVPKNGFRAP